MGKWKTVLLAVFILAVAVFGVYRWRVGSNIDAAKQRMRDAGLPVTYAELDAYYKVPESGENRAYLLQFAIDSMVAVHPRMLDDLPIAGNSDLPHRSEPISEEQVVAMRTFALQNLDVVDAVFESFEYDECRFPIDMNAGPAMLLPHLAQVRSLARVLSIRAILAALNDDSEAAANMVIGIMDLADSLEKEPILISQLVRIAIYGIGLSALEQAMNRVDFSDDQLERLQKRMIEAEQNRAFVQGFIGDRCMWTVIENIGFQQGDIDPQKLWFDLVYRPTGMMDMDGLQYYTAFEDIITACDLPVQDQTAAGEAISNRTEQGGFRGSMTAIYVPAMARAIDADVRNRAYLRTVTVALAAARYKAEQGEYPESADALTPDYLETIPIDPSGGAAIQYRNLDDGFVAYSLAQNGTDEGGEELEDQRFWREGDLTFTVEHEE